MTRPWLRGGQRGDAPGGGVAVVVPDDFALLTEAGEYLQAENGDFLLWEEVVSTALLTEAGDFLTTEVGDYLVQE